MEIQLTGDISVMNLIHLSAQKLPLRADKCAISEVSTEGGPPTFLNSARTVIH